MDITLTMIMAMCTFSFAMSISPGPVNMVIVSSGVTNGVRKTMPFVSGATIGFTLLLAFIGFGFIQILSAYPLFLKYLTVAGSLFIIYVGYKIATATGELNVELEKRKIPGFFEGFLLQWLNSKAWIAAVSGVSLFSSADSVLITFIFCYFVLCYACLAFWAIMGQKAAILLNTNTRLQAFNRLMGFLLIVTAGYLMFAQLS
jgi:threonine/homoserine/homoserine lactone efflux protein